jgi:hypothetical protein
MKLVAIQVHEDENQARQQAGVPVQLEMRKAFSQ